MKTHPFLLSALALTAVLALTLAPRVSSGQAGADDPLLSPLIDEIVKQQDAIVENQKAIDEKIGLIAEDVRVARIFVGRGGGKVMSAQPPPPQP